MTTAYALYGTDATTATGAVVLMVVVWIAFGAGLYVWVSLALSAVFRKAGVPVWRAWVPVVNTWTLFRLGGMRGWWALVVLAGALVLPIVQAVVVSLAGSATAQTPDAGSAVAAVLVASTVMLLVSLAFLALAVTLQVRMLLGIGRGFGVHGGYVVLGVFLFPVWASVLGWGPARWAGPRRVPSGDPLSYTAPAAYAPAAPGASAPPAPGGYAPPAPPLYRTPAGYPVPPMPPVPLPPAPAPGAGAPVPARGGVPGAPVERDLAPEDSESWGWADSSLPYTATDGTPGAAVNARAAAASAPAFPSRSAPATPVGPLVSFDETPAPVDEDDPAGYGPRRTALLEESVEETETSSAHAPSAAYPHPDAVDEHTRIGDRRRTASVVELPDGTIVELLRDDALLGRNPIPQPGLPRAQLVPVLDVTRTISKTHAHLHRTEDGWEITDLDSTNGIVLVDECGVENELRATSPLTGRFFLGDAELRLRVG